MAVEISDYYVWQISVDECWELKLLVWRLIHRINNYSKPHNSNLFNSSLYSFINVLNPQVVSDENSTTILIVGMFSK